MFRADACQESARVRENKIPNVPRISAANRHGKGSLTAKIRSQSQYCVFGHPSQVLLLDSSSGNVMKVMYVNREETLMDAYSSHFVQTDNHLLTSVGSWLTGFSAFNIRYHLDGRHLFSSRENINIARFAISTSDVHGSLIEI